MWCSGVKSGSSFSVKLENETLIEMFTMTEDGTCVNIPRVAPSLRSMYSPAHSIMVLSRNPKPIKGILQEK